jgi:hypothetical protein
MLGGKNPFLEAGGRVAQQDRDLGSAQNLSRIELFGDDVDRTSSVRIASFNSALVGV